MDLFEALRPWGRCTTQSCEKHHYTTPFSSLCYADAVSKHDAVLAAELLVVEMVDPLAEQRIDSAGGPAYGPVVV